MTPPPDPEKDAEECRVLDAQARKDLENDGCPPCYPPFLKLPIQDPPEEYRSIIDYWEGYAFADGVVLCAQRQDWRNFRLNQERARNRYRREEHFSLFLDRARERRRTHGLDGEVHFLADLHKQSRQQTWIEFEDFHLKRKDRWEEERERLKADAASLIPDERDPLAEPAIKRGIEYVERSLRWHDTLLAWIGQQRIEMDQPSPTTIEDGSGAQTSARKASKSQRRSKRQKPSAMLSKAKVSKPTSTSSGVEKMPTRRETKPRRAKETTLDQ